MIIDSTIIVSAVEEHRVIGATSATEFACSVMATDVLIQVRDEAFLGSLYSFESEVDSEIWDLQNPLGHWPVINSSSIISLVFSYPTH